MAAHIPFVNTPTECDLVKRYYPDSPFVRVPLARANRLGGELPTGPSLWVDAGIDGLTRRSHTPEWENYLESFKHHRRIADRTFQRRPDKDIVAEFVGAVLNRCVEFSPKAISVPQLPLENSGGRNRINRCLAEAAGKWREQSGFAGQLILPAIFTTQRQLRYKNLRDQKRKLVLTCYHKSGANALWVVDSSLNDGSPSATRQDARIRGLITFHKEILEQLPAETTIIPGPYWGMNLVLWAKGLCRYLAIGVGGGYRYQPFGGIQRPASIRVALPPLKRYAKTGKPLKSWLDEVLAKLSKDDPAYAEFYELRNRYDSLTNRMASREQLADFYKQWYEELAAVPPAGRTLALFQMFSTAYAIGRRLPSIPTEARGAKRPERVAEYLVLDCL